MEKVDLLCLLLAVSIIKELEIIYSLRACMTPRATMNTAPLITLRITIVMVHLQFIRKLERQALQPAISISSEETSSRITR